MLRNNQSVERTELRHPCLVSTFAQNYTCLSCSGLASIYQKNRSQHQESEHYSLRLTGELDREQCKELAIAAAMNLSDSKVSHLNVSKNCQASSFSGIGKGIIICLHCRFLFFLFMPYLFLIFFSVEYICELKIIIISAKQMLDVSLITGLSKKCAVLFLPSGYMKLLSSSQPLTCSPKLTLVKSST